MSVNVPQAGAGQQASPYPPHLLDPSLGASAGVQLSNINGQQTGFSGLQTQQPGSHNINGQQTGFSGLQTQQPGSHNINGQQTQQPGLQTIPPGSHNINGQQTQQPGIQTIPPGSHNINGQQTQQPGIQTIPPGVQNSNGIQTQQPGSQTNTTAPLQPNTNNSAKAARLAHRKKRRSKKAADEARPKRRLKDVGIIADLSAIDLNEEEVIEEEGVSEKQRKDITRHKLYEPKMTTYWTKARAVQRLYNMIHIGDQWAKRDRTCAVAVQNIESVEARSWAYKEAEGKWDNNFGQWRLHTLKRAKAKVEFINENNALFASYKDVETVEQFFWQRWEEPGGIDEFISVFYWFTGFDIRASTPKAQHWVRGVYCQVMTMAKMWDYYTNVVHKDCLPKEYDYDDDELIELWESIADDWAEEDRPDKNDFVLKQKTKAAKKAVAKRSRLAESKFRKRFQLPSLNKPQGQSAGTSTPQAGGENGTSN